MKIDPATIKRRKKDYPLEEGLQNDTLRTHCKEVHKLTSELKEFGKALQELMRVYEGVGLAAPQVGQLIRMAAVSQRDTMDSKGKPKKKWELIDEFVIINPKILSESETTEKDVEGCLSLPGLQGDVIRPDTITIQYLGLDGKTHIHRAEGFNARVILHEIDHLDGVLFTDKMVL